MDQEQMKTLDIHTVVVGSGASGLNAADRLWQHGVRDMALVTERMNAGTSRNTGSDKQTYYKLSLAGKGLDSVHKLAQVLYDGGCVDGDHALCEAALSCQGFFKLVELGVPFPHNACGEYVGYRTDHDFNDRGTSAGPYTSRYMTEALECNVRKTHIPIYENFQVIQILTYLKKLYGVLCLDTQNGNYVLIRCTNVIYATGGPAGIYADSVYPSSQLGASGIAFEAGIVGKNLTEWQYGLASLNPRWNVSGSYMQVLPRVISTDQDGGDEQEFLSGFYRDKNEMLNMLFLKGYQWPFDVRKIARGSSMIDLLVYRETCIRGRRVWLDYQKNPGNAPIDFHALSEETNRYLYQSQACQQTPYERLCQLNAPAVFFYKEHGVDLKTQSLEVAVCAQHNNGGFSVDAWWQTETKGFFSVGEAAGTHGIYRPGGSALNAGQVGSMRAAEYIAVHRKEQHQWNEEITRVLIKQVKQCIAMGSMAAKEHISFADRWKHAARSMSQCGAFIRRCEDMESMCREIEQELKQLTGLDDGKTEKFEKNIAFLSGFYRYYDMRVCQLVYLQAMLDYKKHGGKSRGSALYEDISEYIKDQNSELELFARSIDSFDGCSQTDMIQEMTYDFRERTCGSMWRSVRKLEEVQTQEAFEVVWKKHREHSYLKG